jgi:alanine dehydrogenase
MNVGCLKEIKKYEFRVGMTPENVSEYVRRGHKVMIEAGAGEGSGFFDGEYAKAGAEVVSEPRKIWAESDMIIKIKEPLKEEYELIREDQIVYTYLHLAADRSLTELLLKNKAKAVAYETIRDAKGGLPLLKPMSEVAGRLSMQEGAKCLEKPMGGMGLLLAGVPGVRRAEVVVLGGGTVGTSACKMAIGLGARVTVLDNNLDRLAYLDDIFGAKIQTLYSTATAIEQALKNADLVIGAVLIPGAVTPKLIKAEYLKSMKPGSVIVDVAIDQGGCCETSRPTYHDNPTFVHEGVVHYCVTNMPGAVAMTSTIALTNATLSYGLKIADLGLEKAMSDNPLIKTGVNCYRGKLTSREVAASLQMQYTDLDALL